MFGERAWSGACRERGDNGSLAGMLYVNFDFVPRSVWTCWRISNTDGRCAPCSLSMEPERLSGQLSWGPIGQRTYQTVHLSRIYGIRGCPVLHIKNCEGSVFFKRGGIIAELVEKDS